MRLLLPGPLSCFVLYKSQKWNEGAIYCNKVVQLKGAYLMVFSWEKLKYVFEDLWTTPDWGIEHNCKSLGALKLRAQVAVVTSSVDVKSPVKMHRVGGMVEETLPPGLSSPHTIMCDYRTSVHGEQFRSIYSHGLPYITSDWWRVDLHEGPKRRAPGYK